MQPPSGGCVLKLFGVATTGAMVIAAAFGRLCVETINGNGLLYGGFAAAFGRLCVETLP